MTLCCVLTLSKLSITNQFSYLPTAIVFINNMMPHTFVLKFLLIVPFSDGVSFLTFERRQNQSSFVSDINQSSYYTMWYGTYDQHLYNK